MQLGSLMTNFSNIAEQDYMFEQNGNEIYWQYNMPNGRLLTSAIQSENDIITEPTFVKNIDNSSLILWGAANDNGHFIEGVQITSRGLSSAPFILSETISGIESEIVAKTIDGYTKLAWINQEHAIESVSIISENGQLSSAYLEESDFALPIENAQIEIIPSHFGGNIILFQTLNDDGFYSWAVKSGDVELVIDTNVHMGMGSWAVGPSGQIFGVTEILDENLQNSLSFVSITDDMQQEQQFIKTDDHIIEAQWPHLAINNHQVDILFSARDDSGNHQVINSFGSIDHLNTDHFEYMPVGHFMEDPIEASHGAYFTTSAVENVIYELSQHDNFAELGLSLSHLSEQPDASLDQFIRVDYNSDATTRIIHVDDGHGDFAHAYEISYHDVSGHILDFFDYIHTDFVL